MRPRTSLLPIALLLVLGCRGARREPVTTPSAAASPWEKAKASGVDFRAVGQEPGWILEIHEGERIDVVIDNGERRVTFEAPVREDGVAARTIYRAASINHRLYVDLDRKPCEDAMSGEAFDVTVTVLLDGYRYSGCGRSLMP